MEGIGAFRGWKEPLLEQSVRKRLCSWQFSTVLRYNTMKPIKRLFFAIRMIPVSSMKFGLKMPGACRPNMIQSKNMACGESVTGYWVFRSRKIGRCFRIIFVCGSCNKQILGFRYYVPLAY